MADNIYSISSVNADNVYLVTSPMGDNFAWYYILLDSLKKPIFEKKIGKDAFDLKDYGKILHTGWGKVPPEDITQQIEEQYG